jgi:hypothetical protein
MSQQNPLEAGATFNNAAWKLAMNALPFYVVVVLQACDWGGQVGICRLHSWRVDRCISE